MSMPSCSVQSTKPAGTTTGVTLGLAGAIEVADGEGSTAGVRVARLITAITDATAIKIAATAKVASPRRSHLPVGPAAGSDLATAGSFGAAGGADSEAASCAGDGVGASLFDRLSAWS